MARIRTRFSDILLALLAMTITNIRVSSTPHTRRKLPGRTHQRHSHSCQPGILFPCRKLFFSNIGAGVKRSRRARIIINHIACNFSVCTTDVILASIVRPLVGPWISNQNLMKNVIPWEFTCLATWKLYRLPVFTNEETTTWSPNLDIWRNYYYQQ